MKVKAEEPLVCKCGHGPLHHLPPAPKIDYELRAAQLADELQLAHGKADQYLAEAQDASKELIRGHARAVVAVLLLLMVLVFTSLYALEELDCNKELAVINNTHKRDLDWIGLSKVNQDWWQLAEKRQDRIIRAYRQIRQGHYMAAEDTLHKAP